MAEREQPDDYTLRAISALGVVIRNGKVPPELEGTVTAVVEAFVTEVKGTETISPETDNPEVIE